MPFYLYSRTEENKENAIQEVFQQLREVRLAGYNVIYNLWVEKGKPLDRGWEISNTELLNHVAGDQKNHSIVIDFDPRAKWRIGLVELSDIYAYTYSYGAPNGKAVWTALMLRLRELFYTEFDTDKDINETSAIKKKFSVNKRSEGPDQDIFEFLYLQGNNGGWNWGRVGKVNAVFLDRTARSYFKKFF
jgi:hypothetical protein